MERDTGYQHFAELLYEELSGKSAQEQKLILARRAYDLVGLATDSLSSYAYDTNSMYVPDVESFLDQGITPIPPPEQPVPTCSICGTSTDVRYYPGPWSEHKPLGYFCSPCAKSYTPR